MSVSEFSSGLHVGFLTLSSLGLALESYILEVRLVYIGIYYILILINMNGGGRADKNGTEQNWFHKIHVNSSNFYLTHIVR